MTETPDSPIFNWLEESAEDIEAVRERLSCTKISAAQLVLLFDIASFVSPDECLCDECRARRDAAS